MKCQRCGKEVNKSNGYETEDGRAVHHGCAMLMDKMPRKKMRFSLAEMIAAKQDVDAGNAERDRRHGREPIG